MNTNQFLPSSAAELVELLHLLPHPEGGFFLETFRSGSLPMSSKGQTNFNVDQKHDLVTTNGRSHCRPDGENRRNCLTSIYWVPTVNSPKQPLVCNESDHVHYYQGGLPMKYTQYDLAKQSTETVILGPDLRRGHLLQYAVKGGNWKCAELMVEQHHDNDTLNNTIDADYSIISEAVGPGFDFYDFHFVSPHELDQQPDEMRQQLKPFLQASLQMAEIEQHYHDEHVQQTKTKERL
ncbi:hypothetical protein MPSEU_001082300 [Mayamaea pseudoterrestris]|nr:hypothetical protein MPSEU_001082300 [Mayamaea pseudoterrestris]